jgi:hypothetical protein
VRTGQPQDAAIQGVKRPVPLTSCPKDGREGVRWSRRVPTPLPTPAEAAPLTAAKRADWRAGRRRVAHPQREVSGLTSTDSGTPDPDGPAPGNGRLSIPPVPARRTRREMKMKDLYPASRKSGGRALAKEMVSMANLTRDLVLDKPFNLSIERAIYRGPKHWIVEASWLNSPGEYPTTRVVFSGADTVRQVRYVGDNTQPASRTW